jgi:hypothetical protein
VTLLATGTIEAIKAGVTKFRARFPGTKVKIAGEDDGGPMFRKGRLD